MTLDPEKVAEALKQPIFPPGYRSQGGAAEAAYIDGMHYLWAVAHEWLAGTDTRWCVQHSCSAPLIGGPICWMRKIDLKVPDAQGKRDKHGECHIIPARLVGVEKP